MAKRIAALAALLLSCASARTGDMATVEILGFSADGDVFAFEEFGIQDGSGFPYANRYYIDTDDDTFLPGTPIRIRLEDEQATVDAARQQTKSQAATIISDEELKQNQGLVAGWNPVTELSAEPHRIVVNPRPVVPPLDSPLEIRLEELSLEQPADCRDIGDVMGFRLLCVATAPGAETRLVHEDTTVPASRGCALGYRIAGVQTFYPEGAEPVFAVLIAVRRFGFEGPDHRFLAVTGKL